MIPFFVYAVECPSPEDLYNDHSERDVLYRATALNNVPCVYRVVQTRDLLHKALNQGLPQAMRQHPGMMPLLHLIGHGRNEGFAISQQEFLSWDELRVALLPVRRITSLLILCMSSCSSFNACLMAMREDVAEVPFYAVVGHVGQPTLADTAVGYTAFYHWLAKGAHISKAVDAMKAASGDQGFAIVWAENARAGYLQELQKRQFKQMLDDLGLTQSQPSGPQASTYVPPPEAVG